MGNMAKISSIQKNKRRIGMAKNQRPARDALKLTISNHVPCFPASSEAGKQGSRAQELVLEIVAKLVD